MRNLSCLDHQHGGVGAPLRVCNPLLWSELHLQEIHVRFPPGQSDHLGQNPAQLCSPLLHVRLDALSLSEGRPLLPLQRLHFLLSGLRDGGAQQCELLLNDDKSLLNSSLNRAELMFPP